MTATWDILAGFALFAAALLSLPLFPAWRTLVRAPQTPPQSAPNPGQAEHIALFEQLIERQFRHLLALARTQGTLRGETENGRSYLVLGSNSYLANEIPSGMARLRTLVVAAGHLDVPGEIICEREIYAEGRINVGHNAVVRALLSPRDIAVNTHARVARWAHSERRIDYAEYAQTKGLTSAGIEITLARWARFEQLIAPRITFGRLPETVPEPGEIATRFEPADGEDGHLLSLRRLEIPANHVAKGDFTVSDQLNVAENCRVIGNLRAGKHLELGRLSTIEGAVFCDGDIIIHEACRVLGPIVAKGRIVVHGACLFGLPDHPTTLSGARISLGEGCIAHGTVWAMERGEVVLAAQS